MIHILFAYKALKKRLSEIPEIKGIFWTNKGTKFIAPFVEIYFNTIKPESLQRGSQNLKLNFVLSLTTEALTTALDVSLERHCLLAQKIYDKLKDFSATYDYILADGTDSPLFNGLQRTQINFGIVENQLLTSEQLYTCVALDVSKLPTTTFVDIVNYDIEGVFLPE